MPQLNGTHTELPWTYRIVVSVGGDVLRLQVVSSRSVRYADGARLPMIVNGMHKLDVLELRTSVPGTL